MNTYSSQSQNRLTPSQQQIGRQYYLRFISVNAFSFICLAESILILYAVKNGANDFILGLLTSFFFLTMPFMFLGKWMVGRYGAARAYAFCWILRNVCASILIFVPFIIKFINPATGLSLLGISVFGFFAFRSTGFTANTPLIGEITNKTNRGQYISQIWLYFNGFSLITMIGLIVILGHSDKISTFQAIIAFGCITGFFSSYLIYRVPETSSPQISGRQPIKKSLAYIIKNDKPRKLLFAWCATAVMIMLVNPFSMVALKNGYQVSDYNAMFFALILIFGGIAVSFFNSVVLDHFGPRPMLILYSFGHLTVTLLWMLTPGSLNIYHQAVIFLLLGICRSGSMTAIAQYFLTIVPQKERVGANMFMYIISGLIAGLAGITLGGGLLNFLRLLDFSDLNVYRTYFLIMFIFLIPLLFIIRGLERVTDWHIKDVLGIFISFRDIRALFTLHRLAKKSNLDQIFLNSSNPQIITHSAHTIVKSGDLSKLILLLKKSITENLPRQLKTDLLHNICELCNCKNEFSRFYKAYNKNPEHGLITLNEIFTEFAAKSTKNLNPIKEQIHNLNFRSHNTQLIEFLKRYTDKRTTIISKTINDFLDQSSRQQLSTELFCCLLLVLGKDVLGE